MLATFAVLSAPVEVPTASADRPTLPDQWSATMTTQVNSTVPNIPSGAPHMNMPSFRTPLPFWRVHDGGEGDNPAGAMRTSHSLPQLPAQSQSSARLRSFTKAQWSVVSRRAVRASGTFVITQYYDYTNKLLRKDLSDGTTKMYDYGTLVDSGSAPWPPFPSPQGFKFRTNDIENSCCWLWLVQNQSGSSIPEAETMSKFSVEKNAKDVGSDERGEHWHSHTWFPFTQNDDWWFKNGTVAYQNSYFKIPRVGFTIENTTYSNVKYGPIDPSVFAHPDSRPQFGKCKQCGVDSACPMWQCMQN
jgi:hypothetical protein